MNELFLLFGESWILAHTDEDQVKSNQPGERPFTIAFQGQFDHREKTVFTLPGSPKLERGENQIMILPDPNMGPGELAEKRLAFLVDSVGIMRTAQKYYFAHRNQSNLVVAKMREDRIDVLLKHLRGEHMTARELDTLAIILRDMAEEGRGE